MSDRAFLDTNIVVYLFDDDEPAKQAKAHEVFLDERLELVLSVQVLGEFYVTVTRKLAQPLDAATAATAVASLAELPVVSIDTALVEAALATSRQRQLSYWDALILESAASVGCATVLTEDLSDGALLGGVTVTNPFL